MFKFVIFPLSQHVPILLVVFPKFMRKAAGFCQTSIVSVVQTKNLGFILNASSAFQLKPVRNVC